MSGLNPTRQQKFNAVRIGSLVRATYRIGGLLDADTYDRVASPSSASRVNPIYQNAHHCGMPLCIICRPCQYRGAPSLASHLKRVAPRGLLSLKKLQHVGSPRCADSSNAIQKETFISADMCMFGASHNSIVTCSGPQPSQINTESWTAPNFLNWAIAWHDPQKDKQTAVAHVYTCTWRTFSNCYPSKRQQKLMWLERTTAFPPRVLVRSLGEQQTETVTWWFPTSESTRWLEGEKRLKLDNCIIWEGARRNLLKYIVILRSVPRLKVCGRRVKTMPLPTLRLLLKLKF